VRVHIIDSAKKLCILPFRPLRFIVCEIARQIKYGEDLMKNRNSNTALSTLFLVLATALTSPTHAAVLNLRTGAWEMTITTVTFGNIMSPSVMEKLSAEQRDQIEKNVQAKSGKPSIQVHKSCIVQKDIDEMNLIKADDKDCTRKIKNQSSTRVELEEVCGGADANRKTIGIESKNPESLLLLADVARDNGSKIHLDVNGRWLAADCKGIPAEDE
jgi:hypothetical protein